MKRITPFLFLIFCSCSNGIPSLSDVNKSQAVEKIKSEIENPSSYESVEWSPLDTAYERFSSFPEYKRMQDVHDSLQREIKLITEKDKNFNTLTDISKQSEKISEVSERMRQYTRSINRKQTGWLTTHKFKIIDSTGFPDFKFYSVVYDMKMNLQDVSDVTYAQKFLEKKGLR